MEDKYIICSGSGLINSPDFKKQINENLANGYKLEGNLIITTEAQRTYFYQAMTLINDNKNFLFLKCPSCGWQMELYKNNYFGCANEDCDNEIEVIN